MLFGIQRSEVLTLRHAAHLPHLEDIPRLRLVGLASCEFSEPPS